MNEHQPLTSYIKHLAISELSSVSARIISSCNLTGKCFEMPNVSYTQPLAARLKEKLMAKIDLKGYTFVKQILYCKTPKEYDIFDYRSLRPRYFVEKLGENGEVDETGVHFVSQEIDDIKINNVPIEYYTPNNVGILLSITHQSLKKAENLFNEIILLNKQHTDRKIDALKNISKTTYNFIEAFQTSIVFSYTALEAFANLSIPDNYEYRSKNKSKGTYEVFNKEAIENWVALDVKLGEILVDIYSTTSIKQKKVWSLFKNLEKFRHDIIHQKSISRTEFYKSYFNKKIFKIVFCADEIIDFFYQEQKNKNFTNPLWPWLINKNNYFSIEKYQKNRFYSDPKNFKPENFKP